MHMTLGRSVEPQTILANFFLRKRLTDPNCKHLYFTCSQWNCWGLLASWSWLLACACGRWAARWASWTLLAKTARWVCLWRPQRATSPSEMPSRRHPMESVTHCQRAMAFAQVCLTCWSHWTPKQVSLPRRTASLLSWWCSPASCCSSSSTCCCCSLTTSLSCCPLRMSSMSTWQTSCHTSSLVRSEVDGMPFWYACWEVRVMTLAGTHLFKVLAFAMPAFALTRNRTRSFFKRWLCVVIRLIRVCFHSLAHWLNGVAWSLELHDSVSDESHLKIHRIHWRIIRDRHPQQIHENTFEHIWGLMLCCLILFLTNWNWTNATESSLCEAPELFQIIRWAVPPSPVILLQWCETHGSCRKLSWDRDHRDDKDVHSSIASSGGLLDLESFVRFVLLHVWNVKLWTN